MIEGVKTTDGRFHLHLEEDRGCDRYTPDEISDFVLMDPSWVDTDLEQWCSECYSNLYALSMECGYFDEEGDG